uniref:Uncharacterized protein n=1 Tax=Tetradesmus obliquus TaxID=3088 RepID=A0A383WN72_TETOB|eukprot:jgi/Sobl393_1/13769/SZX78900.1
MAAASAATREAAAAVAWAWLRGYELAVAAKQEWPGPGPREGDSDLETHLLVQELMAHGVSEVLPLPDGVVIGRCDLRQVAAAADTALQETLRNIGHLLQAGQAALEGGSSGLLGSSSSITSLNTVTQRGVDLQGAEFEHLLSSSAASATLEDLLMLEAAVWAQLDTLIVLANRVRGTRYVLPFGLLQLRPAPVQPSSLLQYKAPAAQGSSSSGNSVDAHRGGWEGGVQPPPAAEVVSDEADEAAAVTSAPSSSMDATTSDSRMQEPFSSSSSSSPAEPQQQGAGASQYAYAASDGCDAHADPLWPPLRRTARLSWAAASVVGQLEQDKAELRQALLECTSVAQRLRFVLAVLGKHIKVLAAVAAVKSVQGEQRPDGGAGTQS